MYKIITCWVKTSERRFLEFSFVDEEWFYEQDEIEKMLHNVRSLAESELGAGFECVLHGDTGRPLVWYYQDGMELDCPEWIYPDLLIGLMK